MVRRSGLRVDELFEVVDFLNVGTNDLVQYLTAADRENDISVCGELASDPQGACELVRRGIRSLSVTPHAADSVREALQAMAV